MEIINITDEIIEVNVTEAVVNVVTQNGAYPLPSNVFSVFGRVGNVVGQIGDYTTSIVEEGTNLYYTQARFDTAFGNKTTTDLDEGTNLYYTDARSRAAISENITGIDYSSASGIFSLASGYVIPTQVMLDAKVPYTGATGNVNLGEYQLSAGQVTFDQTPTGAAGVGVMRWNDTDGTLDLGLKGGNVTLQIGQEQVKRVVNGTGINLTEAAYQVVKVSGAQGQRLQVTLAQANNDLNSATTLGIVTENINNNQEGFITTSGEVRGINTTGSLQGETWADGDILYLSPTTAGKITNIKPVAPNHMVIVGFVEYAHQNNGKIFVKVDNGYELDELHNVKITTPLNNQALIFDSTDSVWKNESLTSALGYTPVPTTRTISTTAPLTGGGDLSADRTISMPAATTSVSGYLTSTDWNTFNNKEGAVAAGTTAQYYRGDKTFQTLDTLAVAENTNLYYTQARFDTAFSGKSTTNLAEGTNLYFTTARAQSAISGTAPIDVSGGVVSISQASGSSNGYLSSTDWNTFNGKQAALNGTGFVKINGTTISYDNSTYLTTISGITAGGELSGTYPNPTLVNSAVTGKVLTGLNLTGGGTIADTDSILGAFGKVQNQISALVGGVMYEGTWDASTNTPTIVSSVGSKGDYYIVSVAGSTNINGITSWNVGDWIIFNGTTWDKVDNTDAVSSVNGYTGAVSLVTSDVPESGNLYFTNDRAIGSTLTGYTSGAGTISSSDTILQAIQKLNGNVSGLVTGVSSVFGRTGAVTAQSGDYTTTQVTEGTNLYYTEGRVSANTDVAANTAARHAAVTIGTANGLSLVGQALSLGLSSGSTTGALSSTDWNTFNNKLSTATAASTYVPYTGATTNVNLGTNSLTAGVGSFASSGSGNTFTIDHGSGSGIALNITKAGNGEGLYINKTSGTGNAATIVGTLNATTLVKNGGTSSQFLKADGSVDSSTYLTTSAASSTYLALTGGTLTGALSGTSATFSGTLQLGASSSTWGLSGFSAQFFGDTGTLYGGSTQMAMVNNGTHNGSNFIYRTTNFANIFTTDSGQFAFSTAPSGSVGSTISFTERLRINNNGNILIGSTTDNGTGKLQVTNSQAGWGGQITNNNGQQVLFAHNGGYGLNVNAGSNASSSTYLAAFVSNGVDRFFISGDGKVGIGTSSPDSGLNINSGGTRGLRIDVNSGVQGFSMNPNGIFGIDEPGVGNGRFCINTSGQVFVGTTLGLGGRMVVNNDATSGISVFDGANNGSFIKFFNNGAVQIGSIVTTNGFSTTYNSTSDYRLKEDLKQLNGLEKLSLIKVYDFKWINSNIRESGVLAHELQEILPYAVNGEKDGDQMQGVDYSKLVPVLIKSIQELKAEIDELKNK